MPMTSRAPRAGGGPLLSLRRTLATLALGAVAASLSACGGPDEEVVEACHLLEQRQWVALDRVADTIESDDETESLVDSLSYVGYQGSHVGAPPPGGVVIPYDDQAGPNLDDAFANAWDGCGDTVEDFPPADGPEYAEASEDIQETARQLWEAANS